MKRNTRYHEVEYKYDGQGITLGAMLRFLEDFGDRCQLTVVEGTDAYWRNGSAVVRHRYQKDINTTGCLTVKYRQSKKTIASRVEVDVMLESGAPPEDAIQFLKRTGYRKEFDLFKRAHIWHVYSLDATVTLVMYDIWRGRKEGNGKPLRFVEVEVEKSALVGHREAMRLLTKWDGDLRAQLGLGEPLNLSLYELFSKKSYKVVDK